MQRGKLETAAWNINALGPHTTNSTGGVDDRAEEKGGVNIEYFQPL